MAALETNDDIGLLRQPVDDLTFAFVAPLGSDNHDIRHQDPFPAPAPGRSKPGATGQVHLRIKEPFVGGKPNSADNKVPAGCNNGLILRTIFRNAAAWPVAPAAARAPLQAPFPEDRSRSRSTPPRCRQGRRARHGTW